MTKFLIPITSSELWVNDDQGLAHLVRSRAKEQCPGHVGMLTNPSVCDRCGTHVKELADDLTPMI